MTASEADKLTRTRLREREAIDATNHALLAQVHAQQDLQAATQAAAEQAKLVAEERRGLEDRLFDLTASEADKIARARQREREAIDATNQSLLAQVPGAGGRRRHVRTPCTGRSRTQRAPPLGAP